MRPIFALSILFYSLSSLAADRVQILYDKTVSDIRVGVFKGQLHCKPGRSVPDFPTATALSLDLYWISVADPEFTRLGMKGKVFYRDPVDGDTCPQHLRAFAGHDFFLGKARRVVTGNYGLRSNGVCWNWLKERITLDVNGYTFEGTSQGIIVGPVARDLCSP